MGINQLKAKTYELAGVNTTPQLQAKYPEIKAFNLRLKASWQRVVDFLHTNPIAIQKPAQTMTELKIEVYTLAQVSTTQQLKAKYESLSSLNFSFKSSWKKSLEFLTTNQQDFQSWLVNPPEEYKALFAEIESVSESFNAKLDKAKQLGQEAQKMAISVEQLAQQAEQEAEDWQQEAEMDYQVAEQAKLN